MFAERLKKMLVDRRVKQAELSRRIGAHRSVLSRALRGEGKLRRGDRAKICRALRVPARQLFPKIPKRNR